MRAREHDRLPQDARAPIPPIRRGGIPKRERWRISVLFWAHKIPSVHYDSGIIAFGQGSAYGPTTPGTPGIPETPRQAAPILRSALDVETERRTDPSDLQVLHRARARRPIARESPSRGPRNPID